jgi:hypothetical protein
MVKRSRQWWHVWHDGDKWHAYPCSFSYHRTLNVKLHGAKHKEQGEAARTKSWKTQGRIACFASLSIFDSSAPLLSSTKQVCHSQSYCFDEPFLFLTGHNLDFVLFFGAVLAPGYMGASEGSTAYAYFKSEMVSYSLAFVVHIFFCNHVSYCQQGKCLGCVGRIRKYCGVEQRGLINIFADFMSITGGKNKGTHARRSKIGQQCIGSNGFFVWTYGRTVMIVNVKMLSG